MKRVHIPRIGCRGLRGALAVLLILALPLPLASCGKVTEDPSRYLEEGEPPVPLTAEEIAEAGVKPDKMEKVADNGTLAMYANLKTAEFFIEDKATGERWFSNPENWNADEKATGVNQEVLGSQVVVDYYSAGNLYGSMNSYKHAFQNGQLTTEKIDGGFKASYLIGVTSSKKSYPQIVRVEVLDELVSKLEEKTGKVLKGRYRLVDKAKLSDAERKALEYEYTKLGDFDAFYVLRPNLSANVLKQMEEEFKEAGFDYKQAEAEEDLFGIKRTETANAAFLIPVEYRLDGADFTARVLTEDIRYTKGAHLTGISLLPYFGAAGAEAEGYMLVPDGSGALINLNRSTANGVMYAAKVFGSDLATKQSNSVLRQQQAYLPVFGIKTATSSVLGIIEDGAAGCTVTAYVGGQVSSYNRVYSMFSPQISDSLGTAANANSMVFPLTFSKQPYAVRYRFTCGESTYVDMAARYREYLVSSGVLSEAAPDGMPFYLELVGAIEKKDNILGIPITVTEPLTTFEQAEEILKRLAEGGVSNIELRYTGWANGGVNNTVYGSAKPLSVLGSSKGLDRLAAYAAENGVGLYPDAELTFVYKDTLFDGFSPRNDASRLVNRQVALLKQMNYSTGMPPSVSRLNRYVLSPVKVADLLPRFLKSYEKFGIEGLSLASLGRYVSGDYRESNPVDRAGAMKLLTDVLTESVKGRYSLLTDGCNASLLPYASGILDMPSSGSSLEIEDASVPFYQIAVSGAKSYTVEAVNLAGDYRRNILKAYEYGAALYCKWMYAPADVVYDADRTDMYALSYETWFDDMVALYKTYEQDMGALVGRQILDHSQTGQLTVTTFEGGAQVAVNYGEEELTYGGKTIAAQSAVILNGGEG